MPEDDFDPEDYENLEPAMATLPRRDLRRFEKAARERDTAKAEAEAARRELAIFKAGIPDTPMTKYFLKAYEGPADVDAIKQAAIEAGIITDAQAGANSAALAGHAQAVAAQTGAGVPGVNDLKARLAEAKDSREIAKLLNEQTQNAGLTFHDALQQAIPRG